MKKGILRKKKNPKAWFGLGVMSFVGFLLVGMWVEGMVGPFARAAEPSVVAENLNNPRGLGFDGVGNLFVAVRNGDKVVKVTPAGVQSDLATGLQDPWGLAVNPASGDVFVTLTGRKEIWKITAAGVKSLVAAGSGAVLRNMHHLVFNPADGLLYVTREDGVSTVNPSTGAIASYWETPYPNGSDNSWGIALDGQGNLFVAMKLTRGEWLFKLTKQADGTVSHEVIGTDTNKIARSLAVDFQGNLYAGDKKQELWLFPGGQGPAQIIGDNEVKYPEGMTIHPLNGNLYITESSKDRVVVKDIGVDGTGPVVTISSPVSGGWVNAASVPIAATWADSDSGIKLSSVSIKLDGAEVSGQLSPSVTGVSGGLTGITEGLHNLVVSVANTWGVPTVQVQNFSVDRTAPVISVTEPAQNLNLSQPALTVKGSVVELGSGISSVTVNGQAAVVAGNQFEAPVVLTEGANTLTVVATDTAGNRSSQVRTVTYTPPDTQAPVAVISHPQPGAVISSLPLVIQGTVSDNRVVAAASVQLTLNGQAQSPQVALPAITHTLTTLTDGQHTLVLSAQDEAGNAAAPVTVQFTVDAAAPQLNLTSPAEGANLDQNTVTVSGTASDAVGPVTLTLNGVQVTLGAGGSFSQQMVLQQGSNVLSLVATDGAGHSSTASRTVVYAPPPVVEEPELSPSVDTVAPVITLSSHPADGSSATAQVTLVGTVSDDIGVTSLTLNGETIPFAGGAFSVQKTLVEGSNTFSFVVADAAGNSTPLVRVLSYTAPTTEEPPPDTEEPPEEEEPPVVPPVDTTAPVIILSSHPANGSSTTAQVTLAGTVSDDTGVVSLSLNGETIPFTGGAFSVQKTLAEGGNTFSFVVTDAAGNSTPLVRVLSYTAPTTEEPPPDTEEPPEEEEPPVVPPADTTAPVITLSSHPVDASSSTAQITLAGTVSDAIGVASFKLNGQTVALAQDGSFSVTRTLVEGTNTFSFVAVDAAGNSNALVRVIGYTAPTTEEPPPDTEEPPVVVEEPPVVPPADTTAPVITLNSPDQLVFSTLNASLNLSGQVSDDSGQTVQVSLGGVVLPTGADGSFSTVRHLEEGLNLLVITATDSAGNTATVTLSITRTVPVDTTPPGLTITSPPSDPHWVNVKHFVLQGQTATGATVTVDEAPAPVGPDGRFSFAVSLSEGNNTILVSAKKGTPLGAGRKARSEEGPESNQLLEIIVDSLPPQITWVNPSPEGNLDLEADIQVWVLEPAGSAGSGVNASSLNFTIDGQAVTLLAQGSTGQFTAPLPTLMEGPHIFFLSVQDVATNLATSTVTTSGGEAEVPMLLMTVEGGTGFVLEKASDPQATTVSPGDLLSIKVAADPGQEDLKAALFNPGRVGAPGPGTESALSDLVILTESSPGQYEGSVLLEDAEDLGADTATAVKAAVAVFDGAGEAPVLGVGSPAPVLAQDGGSYKLSGAWYSYGGSDYNQNPFAPGPLVALFIYDDNGGPGIVGAEGSPGADIEAVLVPGQAVNLALITIPGGPSATVFTQLEGEALTTILGGLTPDYFFEGVFAVPAQAGDPYPYGTPGPGILENPLAEFFALAPDLDQTNELQIGEPPSLLGANLEKDGEPLATVVQVGDTLKVRATAVTGLTDVKATLVNGDRIGSPVADGALSGLLNLVEVGAGVYESTVVLSTNLDREGLGAESVKAAVGRLTPSGSGGPVLGAGSVQPNLSIPDGQSTYFLSGAWFNLNGFDYNEAPFGGETNTVAAYFYDLDGTQIILATGYPGADVSVALDTNLPVNLIFLTSPEGRRVTGYTQLSQAQMEALAQIPSDAFYAGIFLPPANAGEPFSYQAPPQGPDPVQELLSTPGILVTNGLGIGEADAVAPVLMVSAPQFGEHLSGSSVVFSGLVADPEPGSGVAADSIVLTVENDSEVVVIGPLDSGDLGFNPSTGEVTTNLTGLTEGRYVLFLEGADVAGNGVVLTRSFVVDRSVPAVSITAPAFNTQWGGTEHSVTVQVVDGESLLQTPALQNSVVTVLVAGAVVGTQVGISPGQCSGDGKTCTVSVAVNTANLPTGAQPLVAQVSDPAGNMGSASSQVRLSNNVAPVVVITSPVAQAQVQGGFTVTAEVDTATGAVKFVDLFVDGSTTPYATVEWTPTQASGLASFVVDSEDLGLGAHTLTVKAYRTPNRSPRVGEDTVAVMVTAVAGDDSTAPGVLILSPGPAEVLRGVNHTVHLEVSDDRSLVGTSSSVIVKFAQTEVRVVLGLGAGQCNSGGTVCTLAVPVTLTNLPDADPARNDGVVLEVVAVDLAGNEGSGEVAVSIRNNVGPDVAILSPLSFSTVTGTVPVVVSFDAPLVLGQEVRFVDLFVDGGSVPAATVDLGSSGLQFGTVTLLLDTSTLSDGPHTFQARAYLKPGRSPRSGTDEVTVTVANNAPQGPDLNPPSVVIVEPLDGDLLSGTDHTVSLQLGDDRSLLLAPGAVVEIRLAGVVVERVYGLSASHCTPAGNSCTVEVPINIANIPDNDADRDDGLSLSVTLTDPAGNIGLATRTVSTRNNNGPEVTILSPADGAVVSGSVVISASYQDSSNIRLVELFLDQETTPRASQTVTPGKKTGEVGFVLDTSALTPGNHQISVVAYRNLNKSGKAGIKTISVEVWNLVISLTNQTLSGSTIRYSESVLLQVTGAPIGLGGVQAWLRNEADLFGDNTGLVGEALVLRETSPGIYEKALPISKEMLRDAGGVSVSAFVGVTAAPLGPLVAPGKTGFFAPRLDLAGTDYYLNPAVFNWQGVDYSYSEFGGAFFFIYVTENQEIQFFPFFDRTQISPIVDGSRAVNVALVTSGADKIVVYTMEDRAFLETVLGSSGATVDYFQENYFMNNGVGEPFARFGFHLETEQLPDYPGAWVISNPLNLQRGGYLRIVSPVPGELIREMSLSFEFMWADLENVPANGFLIPPLFPQPIALDGRDEGRVTLDFDFNGVQENYYDLAVSLVNQFFQEVIVSPTHRVLIDRTKPTIQFVCPPECQ